MTHAVVELDNIHFVRQDRSILSGVSWRIDKGGHWALMGANGSGKTTLLKIITGYEWPTLGKVTVLGRRFGRCDIRELRKLIGWVSMAIEQKLPTADRAIEVVASGLEASLGLFRTFTDAEYQQAQEALAALKAESIAEQRFEILSQGEQQKVLIARALINQPQVLILDEPCVGLDPAARQRFLRDIAHLAQLKNAPSILLVTHHIEEVGNWVNHVLLLKEGKTMAAGNPDAVLTSDNISKVFDFPCRVKHSADGWRSICGGDSRGEL
jgi:iron complex transport system ATP-binding protein